MMLFGLFKMGYTAKPYTVFTGMVFTVLIHTSPKVGGTDVKLVGSRRMNKEVVLKYFVAVPGEIIFL